MLRGRYLVCTSDLFVACRPKALRLFEFSTYSISNVLGRQALKRIPRMSGITLDLPKTWVTLANLLIVWYLLYGVLPRLPCLNASMPVGPDSSLIQTNWSSRLILLKVGSQGHTWYWQRVYPQAHDLNPSVSTG